MPGERKQVAEGVAVLNADYAGRLGRQAEADAVELGSPKHRLVVVEGPVQLERPIAGRHEVIEGPPEQAANEPAPLLRPGLRVVDEAGEFLRARAEAVLEKRTEA